MLAKLHGCVINLLHTAKLNYSVVFALSPHDIEILCPIKLIFFTRFVGFVFRYFKNLPCVYAINIKFNVISKKF